MHISNTSVQSQNPKFVTSVSPETGNSILVAAKPTKDSVSASKGKSVVDHVIDVGETIVLNLPPSPAGIQRDVDAARAAARDLASVAHGDSDTLDFDIPLEITP